MKYSVYAVADDPYCSAHLTFEADAVFITKNGTELVINDRQDGQDVQFVITTSETFSELKSE